MTPKDLLDALSKLQAIAIMYSDSIISKHGNLSSIRALIDNIGSISSNLKQMILKQMVIHDKIEELKGTPYYEHFTYDIIFSNDFEDYDYQFVVRYILPHFHPSVPQAIGFLEDMERIIGNTSMDMIILKKRIDQLRELIEEV